MIDLEPILQIRKSVKSAVHCHIGYGEAGNQTQGRWTPELFLSSFLFANIEDLLPLYQEVGKHCLRDRSERGYSSYGWKHNFNTSYLNQPVDIEKVTSRCC